MRHKQEKAWESGLLEYLFSTSLVSFTKIFKMDKAQKEVRGLIYNRITIYLCFKVDDLTSVMSSNLTKIMERGEKLEDLESKAEHLEMQSGVFKKNAGRLKQKTMFENHKMKIIGGSVISLIVIITIIILSVWSSLKSSLHQSEKHTLFTRQHLLTKQNR